MGGEQETVDERLRAVGLVVGRGRGRSFGQGGDIVVVSLNEAEQHAAVRHKEGRLAQLLAEACVMEQKQVLQEQQAGRLVIGITRHELAEFVERVAVQAFGVFDEFGEVEVHAVRICFSIDS